MFEQENWFIFGTFRQGLDGWVIEPIGGVDDHPVSSHRAVKRADGLHVEVPPESPSILLRQSLPDIPGNRQALLRAKIQLFQGSAELWVRFWSELNTEIPGAHQWDAPLIRPAADRQSIEYEFVIPAHVDSVQAGIVFHRNTKATLAACEFRIIDDTLEAYRNRLLDKIDRNVPNLDPAIRAAFETVPRHLFLPDVVPAAAYMDEAIATRFAEVDGARVAVSSSSQPTMMAMMLADLDLKAGMRVLEIGAGTGYNAALLAEIVGQENVTSIDIDPEIVGAARENLGIAGFSGVDVVAVDGWLGYSSRAPFDRIIVTVGIPDIAPAWFDQLAEGGLIVAPLSIQCVEFSTAFRKSGDRLLSTSIHACSFMDLRGESGRTMYRRGDGFIVRHDALTPEVAERIGAACRQSPVKLELPSGPGDRIEDFAHYLALRHNLTVSVSSPEFQRLGLPPSACLYAIADLDNGSLAVPEAVYGEPRIGVEMERLNAEWNVLGRPSVDRLRFTAYPRALHPSKPKLRSTPSRGIVEKANTWITWEYAGK